MISDMLSMLEEAFVEQNFDLEEGLNKNFKILGILVIGIIAIYWFIFCLETNTEVIREEYKDQIVSAVIVYGNSKIEKEIDEVYFDELYQVLHIIPVRKYSPYTAWSNSRNQYDSLDTYAIITNFENGDYIKVVQDYNASCLHVIHNDSKKKYESNSKWEINYMKFWHEQDKIYDRAH